MGVHSDDDATAQSPRPGRRGHLVKLPDEVPVGPAEIIVLVEDSTAAVGTLDDFEPIEPLRPVGLSGLVIEARGWSAPLEDEDDGSTLR